MPTEPKLPRAARGFRRVSFTVRVNEYELLSRLAEQQSRTPDQQALYFLRQALLEVESVSYRAAYREAEARREADEDGVASVPDAEATGAALRPE
jgi:hypothetical protein